MRAARVRFWALVAISAVCVGGAVTTGIATTAHAIEIVLKGAAPDRIERQRAEANGDIPLPGTPDLAKFEDRKAAAGVSQGDHVFIRIFKEEAELELWVRKGDRFERFATYPICFWSGDLGPKLAEGDKQTPEGFYTVRRRQLHVSGRWRRALNLGFPNVFDKANKRTGSYILVHGGCSSVGCYAMTDAVLKEIHWFAANALRRGGQQRIHVHAFPFRMTTQNMRRHAGSPHLDFWSDLKAAYDLFEETKIPPRIGVCRGRYVAARGTVELASRSAIRTVRVRAVPDDEDIADDRLVCPPVETAGSDDDQPDVEARGPAANNSVRLR
jgi:murein L,D-transpeptidase YafK